MSGLVTTACWAFNAQGAGTNKDTSGWCQDLEIYKNMGTPFYVRSKEEYVKLIESVDTPTRMGFIPLLEWHGLDKLR